MAFVKIENNIVVLKIANEREGFVEAHNDVICGMIHDGSDEYGIDNFSNPPIALTWDDIRHKRDILLYQSDWTQLPDCPLYQNQDWLDYRQALRDITETYETTSDVVWPEKP